MPATNEQVKGNVQGIVVALAKLTHTERFQFVSPELARNLNTALELAIEVNPSIDARLWPKPIEIVESYGIPGTNARYADVEAYARQVLSLTSNA